MSGLGAALAGAVSEGVIGPTILTAVGILAFRAAVERAVEVPAGDWF